MKSQLNEIAWITRQPDKFKGHREVLTQCGYKVHWVTLPEFTPELDVRSWLSSNLPEKTRAVLIEGDDSRWLVTLIKALKHSENTKQSLLPTVWLSEVADHSLLERLIALGVDDYCWLNSDPVEFKGRIQIVTRLYQARETMQIEIQERESKDAASQTALKQREEFLSVCTHDLRSPLGLIQSCMSLIINSYGKGLPPTVQELLNRSRSQASYALTLVNDLLDVMTYEQGLLPDYEVIPLHDLLSEFHQDYAFQAKQKGIEFEYFNPIKQWQILGDPDRIRQLLQNLFVNALKFTESGKKIYMNVMPFQGRRKSDPTYPMLIVSVRDEGKGIAKETLEKIFDKYTQIKGYSRAEGRGLGLTVAKQISQLHSGNIWVESEEGKGSTFHCLFPHVISKRSIKQTSVAKKPPIKKILIVEPSEKEREHLKKLNRWGYQVSFVADGVEAVVQTFHEVPDLVIVTPGLCKMTEEDVSNILKSDPATCNIPILLVGEKGAFGEKKVKKMLIDHTLTLPLLRESFKKALNDIRKRREDGVSKAA